MNKVAFGQFGYVGADRAKACKVRQLGHRLSRFSCVIAQLVNTAAEISGKDCDSEYSEVDLKAVLEEAEWQVELVKLKQETSDDD